MRHAATRFLFTYWNHIRRDRMAPERREVEPADIGRVLSDTFILEASEADAFPYRLAGTRICTLFGRELKGVDWMTGWNAADCTVLRALLRRVVAEAAGAIITSQARNERGQTVPLETILLPLLHRDSGFQRILGATSPLDEPYWLGAQPVREATVSAVQALPPSSCTTKAIQAPPTCEDEPLVPLRRCGHLALYDGGRLD